MVVWPLDEVGVRSGEGVGQAAKFRLGETGQTLRFRSGEVGQAAGDRSEVYF